MIPQIDTSSKAIWKQRYRAPIIISADIAPHAPERGLVWTNLSGSLQFHTWDVATGQLSQLTHTPGGHTSFLHLSPDGQWLYYLKDEHGNEIGHFVRIPYTGGEPEDITPDSPPYSSFDLSISRSGNRLGYVIAGADGFSIYIMDVSKRGKLSAPRKLYHCPTIAFGPAFTADGSLAVVLSTEHTGKNEFSLLAFDTASGEKIAEWWEGEGYSLGSPTPSPVTGDSRFVVNTNRSGIEQLAIWNPRTGKSEHLPVADIPGAQSPHSWSPDGKQLIFSTLHQAVQSLYMFDFTVGRVEKLAAPVGEYYPFFTPGQQLFALRTDSAHPLHLVELDPASGAILRTVLAVGAPLPGKGFKSISFPSSDGTSIQGWLCVPDGNCPFPTILDTHGGPAGVRGSGFDPGAQAWVDHGFAFLSINYHGSITFGREFEQSIWGDLGHWELEDMVMAHKWLVEERIAAPGAVFLTGWSYGGYLTLFGLGKRPDLWAGGMAGIAIADWAMMYEDDADTLRGYDEAMFGCKPSEDPERYRRSSPIAYAENVRAPLLIIQGLNDTRTPPRQMQAYEAKMKELGKDLTVHWFETGHMGSFADVELSISHQEMMMSFARKVLGN